MALVSYDVSDASDDEEEETPAVGSEAKIRDIEPEESIKNEEPETSFHSVLPTPKTKPVFSYSDLSQKLLLSKTSNSSSKKSVKIAVPSLSEFDEDLPTPTTKKITPSAKGSGLFALLPPPKNSAAQATDKKLVPDSLRKRPPPKPAPKLPVKALSKPLLAPVVEDPADEDDDAENTSDFLGLNSRFDPEPEPSPIVFDVSSTQPYIAPMEIPQTQTSIHTIEEVNPAYPPKGDVIPIASEDLELDDEALQKLCGGSKRRRANVPTNLIDVSERDVVPDKNEWMLKNLSEQNTVKRQSHKKNVGPSSQQKRKHQITYLAYQAKEQELELQNQWAQNRMTKKQTQSKYGF